MSLEEYNAYRLNKWKYTVSKYKQSGFYHSPEKNDSEKTSDKVNGVVYPLDNLSQKSDETLDLKENFDEKVKNLQIIFLENENSASKKSEPMALEQKNEIE